MPSAPEMHRLIAEDGALLGEVPAGLGDDDLLEIHRLLHLSRAFDDQAFKLVRQGRISFYAGSRGHEGAQVGSGYALEPHDWVFPSPHRELGVHFAKGATPFEKLSHYFGRSTDPTQGRQMPNHFGSRELNIVPPSTAVGTRIPHAAGVGFAARCKGDPTVGVAYFGDGATSMGEFHIGLNFAAVFKSQAVFFCINNLWAISVPLERQMGVPTIAERAAAYGFPGVLVDGNDPLATWEVTKRALDRARSGDGPTLIEARVVRLCAHTSFDDESRYRDPAEIAAGEKLDSLVRFRAFLERQGLWDAEREADLAAACRRRIDEAAAAAEAAPLPAPDTLHRHVFHEGPEGG